MHPVSIRQFLAATIVEAKLRDSTRALDRRVTGGKHGRSLTRPEWDAVQCKHVDHHLCQSGV